METDAAAAPNAVCFAIDDSLNSDKTFSPSKRLATVFESVGVKLAFLTLVDSETKDKDAVAEEDLLGRPVTVAKTGLAILLVGDCGCGFKLVVGVTGSILIELLTPFVRVDAETVLVMLDTMDDEFCLRFGADCLAKTGAVIAVWDEVRRAVVLAVEFVMLAGVALELEAVAAVFTVEEDRTISLNEILNCPTGCDEVEPLVVAETDEFIVLELTEEGGGGNGLADPFESTIGFELFIIEAHDCEPVFHALLCCELCLVTVEAEAVEEEEEELCVGAGLAAFS